jgi:hypothetical protein
MRQDEGHLEEDLDLARDGIWRAILKTLSAVASLQEKALASCRLSQCCAQTFDFRRENERRIRANNLKHVSEGVFVLIDRLLLDRA